MGGGHEERGGRGDYRTLCFHTNACVNRHTHTFRYTTCARESTQTILDPCGQNHKRAYVSCVWLQRGIESIRTSFPSIITSLCECKKRNRPLFSVPTIKMGKYNKQLLVSIIPSVLWLWTYTSVHTHRHTAPHMTEWLAADIHRWGVEKEANPNLFTSLLNKAALSVRLISNMFRIGSFFRSVLLFSDCLQFFAPPVLFYSWESVPGRQKNKEKIKSIEKKKGDTKILFNFLILELWFFSPLCFLSLSLLSVDAPLLALAVVLAFLPRVSAHVYGVNMLLF